MITTVTGKNQITISAELARELDITPGTKLDWTKGKAGVLVVKIIPNGKCRAVIDKVLSRILGEIRLNFLLCHRVNRLDPIPRVRHALTLDSSDIAADTLLTRALHPNPFEANGMSPTYETMH